MNADTEKKLTEIAPTEIAPTENALTENAPVENIPAENSPAKKNLTEAEILWRQFILAASFTSLLLLTATLPTILTLVELRPPAIIDPTLFPLRYSVIRLGLALPAAIIARKFFPEGFRALIARAPNAASLIVLSASAAFVQGTVAILRTASDGTFHSLYFEFAALILTLAALGRYLDSASKSRVSSAIEGLMSPSKKTAAVIRDGHEITLPVEQIALGDRIILHHGQTAPADGEVTEGFATMNEALITGKSASISKKTGDKITGASLNLDGSIKYLTTAIGETTASALTAKSARETLPLKNPRHCVDLVSGYFALSAITIAVGSGLAWLISGQTLEFSLTVFLSVLIVACPCGMGLITPLAIMFGRSKGAQRGLFIKNGDALDAARRIHLVALDKTGTITENHSVVTDIIAIAGEAIAGEAIEAETELITLSASAEGKSQHPIGNAIVSLATDRNIPLTESENFYAIQGRGIEASINGKNVLLGNTKLMRERGINLKPCEAQTQQLTSQGKILTYVMASGKLLGIIAVSEALKNSGLNGIKKLQALGLEVIMLTGDEKNPSEFVAKEAGIETVFAGLSAEGKVEKLRELSDEGKILVAMVGDGINDAPALTAANVGMALSSGSPTAADAADIVLDGGEGGDGLSHVPGVVLLSRKVMGTIKEGLFLSFGCSLLAMAIASGAFFILGLSPATAALIICLSSASSVACALRLKNINLEDD